MNCINLIFPNQLFRDLTSLDKKNRCFLVEEEEFFTKFNFNKNKLVLHRSSMKFYQSYLKDNGYDVVYIEFDQSLAEEMKKADVEKIITYEPNNFDLEKKIINLQIPFVFQELPMFLTSKREFGEFFAGKKHFSQTSFYIYQRKKHKILVDKKLKPVGDRWTFDKENRSKIPEDLELPILPIFVENKYVKEAKAYVNKNFFSNLGDLDAFNYPTTYEELDVFVDDFIENRFEHFGTYQDAIVKDNSFLFHSNLSFALNIGLITPKELIDKLLPLNVPMNSKEGYIRQIIGWREFVNGVYNLIGEEQQRSNFWNFDKKIGTGFYTGKTGVLPIDDAIKKLLKTGYINHIERLMLLGNFFLLCEIGPAEVYRWFMELSMDSYPWVMCANVFGMSQFSDGGKIVTKPYISSSNYILKMSNYKQAPWCEIFDSLFWSFVYRHDEYFKTNPRLKILTINLERKSKSEIQRMLAFADEFVKSLLK